MLLALVLEFDSHRGEISLYLQKCKKKLDQLLRTSSSVGRYNSTRLNEGSECRGLLAIKNKRAYRSAEGGGGPAM